MENKVRQEPRGNNGVSRILAAEQYIGPIPPAEEFAKYGQVLPDAPERIFIVFEKDSEHTRNMQSEALNGEIARDARGQWMAFISILCSIGLTAYSLSINKDIAAALAGLASLFLVFKGAFSRGSGQVRSSTNKEPIKKNA